MELLLHQLKKMISKFFLYLSNKIFNWLINVFNKKVLTKPTRFASPES